MLCLCWGFLVARSSLQILRRTWWWLRWDFSGRGGIWNKPFVSKHLWGACDFWLLTCERVWIWAVRAVSCPVGVPTAQRPHPGEGGRALMSRTAEEAPALPGCWPGSQSKQQDLTQRRLNRIDHIMSVWQKKCTKYHYWIFLIKSLQEARFWMTIYLIP